MSVLSSRTGTESDTSFDSDEDLRLVQEEWEESLQQLQVLISIVLLPCLGKWLGRRTSLILYNRYLSFGLGRNFWLRNSK